MRHYKKGRKLGTDASHTAAIKKNLVVNLFLNDRIKTTLERAKEIRGDADKIITWAKRGDVHSRRLAIAKLGDKQLVAEIFAKVEQGLFKGRPGGYTRIYKVGKRRGDGATIVLMELVQEPVQFKKKAEQGDDDKKSGLKVERKAKKAKDSDDVLDDAVIDEEEALDEDDLAEDESVEDESAEDESADDESIEDEAAEDESAEDEVAEDESAEDESDDEAPAEDGSDDEYEIIDIVVDEVPGEEQAADEAAAEEAAEEVTAEEAPATEEVSEGEEAPAEEAPAGEDAGAEGDSPEDESNK